jgi:hypothetical protein
MLEVEIGPAGGDVSFAPIDAMFHNVKTFKSARWFKVVDHSKGHSSYATAYI